jgi:hypothetical protein
VIVVHVVLCASLGDPAIPPHTVVMARATERLAVEDDRRTAFIRAADRFVAGPALPAALQSLAELGALVADVCIVEDLGEGGRVAHVAVGLAGASPALEAAIGERLHASMPSLACDRPRGLRLAADRDYTELAGDAGATLRDLGVTSGLVLPIVPGGRREATLALFSRDGTTLPDEELVRQLADLAERCYHGERPFLLSSHPAAALVNVVVRGLRALARSRGLVLRRHMKYRGPVLCDRDRTLEVLSQLVENAVSCTSNGRVTVRVDREDAFARFLVEDTGPGIPAGRIAWLVESASASALHRVRALVEAQGGTLGVESEVGHGSRFRFTLRIPD